MRRFLSVVLMLVLLLQASWSAAAAVCQHEPVALEAHFGHHVHLDAHNCLEVIVMRGETGLVQDVSNLLLGTKGVKNGRLVLTTTGKNL